MSLNRILNPVIGVTGLLALALSATLAVAEVKERMKIKVMTDDGVAETVAIENLKVGETDVFTTESGKEVLVTRGEEQLTLEIEGRVIDVKMPQIQSLHEHEPGQIQRRVFISDDGGLHSVDGDHVWVDKSGEETVIEADSEQRVMIHKEVHGHLSDEEMAELMEDVMVDIEIEGDGTTDHEVIMIKKVVTEAVEEEAGEDQ